MGGGAEGVGASRLRRRCRLTSMFFHREYTYAHTCVHAYARVYARVRVYIYIYMYKRNVEGMVLRACKSTLIRNVSAFSPSGAHFHKDRQISGREAVGRYFKVTNTIE